MAINLKLSSSAGGTRNVTPSIVNMGGGANLIQRSLFSTSTPTLDYANWYAPGAGSPAISTADYYGMNGIWQYTRAQDLLTMGSEGAAIAASTGFRYIWIMGCDHPLGINFQGSGDFYVGYSNDPQIWPSPTTVTMLRRQEDTTGNPFTDNLGHTQTNTVPYMSPQLVYNPDASGDKFWIYAEAQGSSGAYLHELSLFTTSDFVTTTFLGPLIATAGGNAGSTSLGWVTRNGTGSWEYIGWTSPTSAFFSYEKYSSTDGLSWTQTTTNGASFSGGFPVSGKIIAPGPFTTFGGQTYVIAREPGTVNDYLSFYPVDATNKTWTGGTPVRISSAFGPSAGGGTAYPGPTYLQGPWPGTEEDGVMTVVAQRGFFASNTNYTLNSGPFLNVSPTYFGITGTIASNVLTVSAIDAGSTLDINQQLLFLPSAPKITSFGTGTGGIGTYNITTTSNIGSPTAITMCANGGLWQQFIDMYYYVTDATAAAGAAPMGVTCDCTSGVVTVSWNDVLPNRTYRVYRFPTSSDATAGTGGTLVGDVTGVSITDTPTVGSQYWYKVFTMLSGVEQKSRIVHCYVSNNTQMVNRHANRVIDDGGDVTKINFTFLAGIDSYLTTNDYYKYLMWWADARFGIKESGGFITKIYCLGTTRMPKNGDYTPTSSNTFPSTSSNTSYSSNSFRGTTPSWINNASSAHGYFGNGRANIIQRKNEITLIAAYQKPNTSLVTLFGMSQFAAGLYLQHASGSSGNVTAKLYSSATPTAASSITATAAFSSATNAHVAAFVLTPTTLNAWLDGVAGVSPADSTAYANPSMLNDSVLRGHYNSTSSTSPVLVSGSQTGLQTLLTRAYTMDNQGQFTCAALIVFEKGLPDAAIIAIGGKYA